MIDYAKADKKPVEPGPKRGMPQGLQGDMLPGGSLGVLGKVDSDEKGANDMTQSSNFQNTDSKPVPQPDITMKVKVDMDDQVILEKQL